MCCFQSSYRKAVTAARQNKKNGKQQGLTEEQKQEIRSVLHRGVRVLSASLQAFTHALQSHCVSIVDIYFRKSVLFNYEMVDKTCWV